DLLEAEGIDHGERHEFVVALEEMLYRPEGNGDVAVSQLLMNLGNAPVLGIAQSAHQGNDVKTKLVLGEHQPALLFRPIGLLELRTRRGAAPADVEGETLDAAEGRDRAVIIVGSPHGFATRGTVADQGLKPMGHGRMRSRGSACHGAYLHRWVCP